MSPVRRPLLMLLLALLGIALAGCPAANLRDAQSHFSAGASAENRQTLDELTDYQLGVPELSQQQALAEYRLACESADGLVRTNAAGLKQDGLLGTAKVLSIYSRWRLLAMEGIGASPGPTQPQTRVCSMDAEALSAYAMQAAQEHAANQISLGARDAAMVEAIPGFLDHERGLAATDWAEASRRLCSSVKVLEDAASNAPADHDVRAYLYLAQLQSIGAWFGAAEQFSTTGRERIERKQSIIPFQATGLCGLQNYVALKEPGGKGPITRLTQLQIEKAGLSPASFDCSEPQVLPAACP